MKKLQIDIVSDVMCPWCIVGYKGLEIALEQLAPEIEAEIKWLPFELNPQMSLDGQDLREHLMEKYGITEEQSDQNRDMLIQRGNEVGFSFKFSDQMRMINSFNLHRLLAWASDEGKQHQLQMAFFDAHFAKNLPLNETDTVLKIVESVGLDPEKAKAILSSDEYQTKVRAEQKDSMQKGINSVPTFIINNKYALSGGQPAETFKQALSQIADEESKEAAGNIG